MKILYYIIILATLITLLIIPSCKTSQVVMNKTGAQLWGENCIRCHTAPSPTDYSNRKWDLIVTHMQVRAQLTEVEKNKIIEFLNSAN